MWSARSSSVMIGRPQRVGFVGQSRRRSPPEQEHVPCNQLTTPPKIAVLKAISRDRAEVERSAMDPRILLRAPRPSAAFSLLRRQPSRIAYPTEPNDPLALPMTASAPSVRRPKKSKSNEGGKDGRKEALIRSPSAPPHSKLPHPGSAAPPAGQVCRRHHTLSFPFGNLLSKSVPALVEGLFKLLAGTNLQMIPYTTDHHFPAETGLA